MDLSTTYLGLPLKHPFMPGASPMVDDLGWVRRLEDAGASAIVMHSLFEEQIARERFDAVMVHEMTTEAFAEALSFFPQSSDYALGPDEYLGQVRRIKDAVHLPVIASLNGMTPSGWPKYARLMEEAGASALELNMYFLATEAWETAEAVESSIVEALQVVKQSVRIPVAVKLSPFFSALPSFAKRLDQAGVDGLVIFNRFYQPDIDPEALEVVPRLQLSSSDELLLRLRWAAILSGQVRCSLAITGGVHTGMDALKAVMSGAHAVQLVSALLRRGPEHLRTVVSETSQWLEAHEYESLAQAHGSMSHARCPDARALERANYIRILQSWRPDSSASRS